MSTHFRFHDAYALPTTMADLPSPCEPGRTVSRKVERGSDRDHVRIVYNVEKAPLFHFQKLGDYIVGHSKQALSFGLAADFDHHGAEQQPALYPEHDLRKRNGLRPGSTE